MSSTLPTGGEPFDRLLAALDADRDRAGERYEIQRRKLVRLFGWRGCLEADRCADETLDRVARRLAEGADVPDVAAYCHGVAMNVLREYWRRPERRADAFPNRRRAAPPPDPDALRREARLECLDGCLAGLEEPARALLVRYHAAGEEPARDRRTALARELGLPLNALRIRTHRLRAALARCIEACASDASAAGPGP